jgi:hypothetical protein
MSPFSSFLFARPSLTEGVARIVDFGNTLNSYNSSMTPEQADFFAILADWRAVGQDLSNAAAACIGSALEASRVEREAKKAARQRACATPSG